MSDPDDSRDDELPAQGEGSATRQASAEYSGPIVAQTMDHGRTLFTETDHSERWIETDLTVEIVR